MRDLSTEVLFLHSQKSNNKSYIIVFIFPSCFTWHLIIILVLNIFAINLQKFLSLFVEPLFREHPLFHFF